MIDVEVRLAFFYEGNEILRIDVSLITAINLLVVELWRERGMATQLRPQNFDLG